MAEPTESKPDQLKDEGHAFDGIQEYDNNLPRWWLGLFYATIIWAVLYIPYYHFGPGRVGVASLRHEQAELAETRARLNQGKALDEAGLRALTTDPARIARGRELYAKNACTTCHGAEGLGSIGPNLRDSRWICEPSMTGIIGLLERGGRPGKGMAPYAHVGTEGLRDLATFIVSLNREGLKANPAKPPAADEPERPLDW